MAQRRTSEWDDSIKALRSSTNQLEHIVAAAAASGGGGGTPLSRHWCSSSCSRRMREASAEASPPPRAGEPRAQRALRAASPAPRERGGL